MAKKLNILIVGGTGVISYAVVNEALKQGIHVTCINRGKSRNQTLSDEVEVIIADYHNFELIESKLQGRYFDAIIDVLCYTEKDIDYSVSLFKDKCDQYIFFSSCAVYNKGKGDYECTEDSELINPVWSYSVNKVKCEKKLIELSERFGFIYTIVRPAVTYGNTRIPYGITPPYGYHGTIIQRILHKKPIILWDNGEAYSTITHVEDFAIGLVGLLGNPKAYNQAFHIVGDERHKWREVIDTLGDILGVRPVFVSLSKEEYAKEVPDRSGEILGGRGISQFLDNSKLKDAVPGFKTNIPLREGLKMTVDYYKSHNYLSGMDYKFDADTDRIISMIYKQKKVDKGFNLHFIDYLGNATVIEKKTYCLEYHKDNLFVKIINNILIVLQKINRRICK